MYKIALACDHGGYELKEMIAGFLLGMGHDIFDLGTIAPNRWTIPNTDTDVQWLLFTEMLI